MEEAEQLSDNIGFIKEGHIIETNNTINLKNQFNEIMIIFSLKNTNNNIINELSISLGSIFDIHKLILNSPHIAKYKLNNNIQ